MAQAIETLTTERLTLRPLAVSQAEVLFPIYSHPQAMAYWASPCHQTVAETQAMIAREVAPERACWWSLWRHADNRAIGVAGYLGNEGVPGMGYILHPDCWGQGYMGEAVAAALDYGFDVIGLDRVELWIVAENRASRRLAERLGFSYRGSLRQRYAHQMHSHEKAVYGLFAHEWQGKATDGNGGRIYDMQPILPVHSVADTAAFYRDRLGFSIDFLLGDPPTYGCVARSEWTCDGARIQLTQVGPDAPLAQGLALYFFVGPAIDALYRRYLDQGVEVVSAPETRPWGMREFSVRDCNGYLLRFGTPV